MKNINKFIAAASLPSKSSILSCTLCKASSFQEKF